MKTETADITLRTIKAAIRLRVGNLHVGTPDARVEMSIRDLLAELRHRYPHLTVEAGLEGRAVKAALREHKSNQNLYRYVTGR